jgi:hypothetical protein
MNDNILKRTDMNNILPEEIIISRIYFIRNRKIMLDMDLAELYGVETKQLKRAVRRNIDRFPLDFMFEINPEELKNWRRQFGTSNREKMGLRIPPFAFTEQGVAMLSSVLKSKHAVMMNIQIIRVFTKMRELLVSHKEILYALEQLQKKDVEQDQKIQLIFEYLKQLEKSKQQQTEQENRKRIRFKTTGRK